MKRAISAILAILTVLTSLVFTFPSEVSAAGTDITLDFTNPANIGYVTFPNSTAVMYSTDENAVLIACTGDNDPYANIEVGKMAAVSADRYKYVVITYRTPVTNSAIANNTELFMCAGSIGMPTAGYSVTYAPQNGYKYRSQIVDMTGKSYWNGTVHCIRFDVFDKASLWDAFYLSSVTFCDSAAAANSAAVSTAAAANGYISDIPEATLASGAYSLSTYTLNYWQGNIVYNESVYPLQNPDGTIPLQSMMYNVKRAVTVRNGALNKEYKYGKDYIITDGKLQILPTGEIPTVKYSDYRSATPVSGTTWQPALDGGAVFFSEGSVFHNTQLFVTYTHDDTWKYSVPESGIENLPKTYSKLEGKQHINAMFFGDSIMYGCNATGIAEVNAAPKMPKMSDLITAGLKAKFGYNDISCNNTAVGGTTSEWGHQTVYQNLIAYAPDIVFLNFGTNDGTLQRTAAQYSADMRGIIDSVRAYFPNCEFVLISPIVTNPETYYYGTQELFLPVLRAIENDYSGVFVVDMFSEIKELLTVKKYADISGNNVNHPNDFLIRYYAQSVLAAFTPSEIDEVKAAKISALAAYKNPADYKAAEQTRLFEIIAEYTEKINGAEDASAVKSLFSQAAALIDSLKTAAEYDIENLDYTKLKFNSAAMLATVASRHNTAESFLPSPGCAMISSTGEDPYFRIGYGDKNISADKYKYVVLVYSVPENVVNASWTELFFTTSAYPTESATASLKFTASKGSTQAYIADLSSQSWWTGNIKNIRIDTFHDFIPGDFFCMYSLCLFETEKAAEKYIRTEAGISTGTYYGVSENIYFDKAEYVSQLEADLILEFIGDADKNGAVNAQDSLAMAEYFGGLRESLPGIADADGDGYVNSKDAYKLKMHLAGVLDLGSKELGRSADIRYDGTVKGARISPADGFAVNVKLFGRNIAADDFGYVTLIYKASSATPVTLSLISEGEAAADSAKTVTLAAAKDYAAKTIDVTGVSGWQGSADKLKLSFTGSEDVCLYDVILSDTAAAANRSADNNKYNVNYLTGAIAPVTGPYTVPFNSSETVADFLYYSGFSNGTYTFGEKLEIYPRRAPDVNFDRFSIRYAASTNLRGVIEYIVDGERIYDEFFLEAAPDNVFNSLIDGYMSERTASEIVCITLYNTSGKNATFALTSLNTADYQNYTGTLYLENANVKAGILLTMGGGMSYYEVKNDGNPNYGNLLNCHDVGRLVQQSYYGINTAPYVMGDMGGQPWRYNPVQGGDVGTYTSRIIDVAVAGNSIYVKVRPMDWGHSNHQTPSYMENMYTLYDNFVHVANRFVDFSGYKHTPASQELPAFYTIQALDRFCYYNGNSPWTGAGYTALANLGFWGEAGKNQYYPVGANSENWYAWTDSSGFGVGVYVTGIQKVIAGRVTTVDPGRPYDPNAFNTSYFAPLRELTLKSGKPLSYSYIICGGNIGTIRETFKNNRGLVNNTALVQY